MNWKLMQEAIRSSGGARPLQMKVECDAPGHVKIYDVPESQNDMENIRISVESTLGAPSGPNSVKYLIFRDAQNTSVAGVGYGWTGQSSDPGFSTKDSSYGGSGNYNRRFTTSAIVWHGHPCCTSAWGNHVTLHELMHTLGGTQYPTTGPAPWATPGSHCLDGLDALCYDDGTLAGYGETRCPANGYYNTPNGVPLDCGYDTYFDAQEEPGEWLNSHWNVGGAENPFLTTVASDGILGLDAVSRTEDRIISLRVLTTTI